MAQFDRTTETALRAFKQSVPRRYGTHLRAVYLFGSRAGGRFEPDSDADVAVFLDRVGDPLQEQLDLVNETFSILLSTGICIQPWVFEADSLQDPEGRRAAHLIRTIRQQGISL